MNTTKRMTQKELKAFLLIRGEDLRVRLVDAMKFEDSAIVRDLMRAIKGKRL